MFKGRLSAPVTYDFDDTALHGDRVETPVDCAGHDLVQEESHEVLVRNEPPQVNVQVVRVNLHLLKAKPANRFLNMSSSEKVI